eukprot:ctg_858.g379
MPPKRSLHHATGRSPATTTVNARNGGGASFRHFAGPGLAALVSSEEELEVLKELEQLRGQESAPPSSGNAEPAAGGTCSRPTEDRALNRVLDELARVEPTSALQGIGGREAPGTQELVDTDSTLEQLERDLRQASVRAEHAADNSTADDLRTPAAEQDTRADGNIDALVDTLVQSILSKEVLYTPMLEIRGLYEYYLNAHASGGAQEDGAPSATDRQRYRAQYACVNRIIQRMEDESGTPAEQTQQIMQLISEMESMGDPPPGVVEAMGNVTSAANPSGDVDERRLAALLESLTGPRGAA